MDSTIIQLVVLAVIAIFLILRLKNTLGSRGGFERKPKPSPVEKLSVARPELEVIEGGQADDPDIVDHVEKESPAAKAFVAMKKIEPDFSVGEFLKGARAAYEMIVMGYENGDLDALQPLLSPEIYESFVDAVAAREDENITIEAEFFGIREMKVLTANLDVQDDTQDKEAEITILFVSELTSVARNKDGNVIEGSASEVKRQKDTWTFSRIMGSDDLNWVLVATDA